MSLQISQIFNFEKYSNYLSDCLIKDNKKEDILESTMQGKTQTLKKTVTYKFMRHR